MKTNDTNDMWKIDSMAWYITRNVCIIIFFITFLFQNYDTIFT